MKILTVFLFAAIAGAQSFKPALPAYDPNWMPPVIPAYEEANVGVADWDNPQGVTGQGNLSTGTLVAAVAIYRTIIYAQPRNGNILIEFRNPDDKLTLTVFTDGTVKVENGADLDKTTKGFWKNLADAFATWKESACSVESRK